MDFVIKIIPDIVSSSDLNKAGNIEISLAILLYICWFVRFERSHPTITDNNGCRTVQTRYSKFFFFIKKAVLLNIVLNFHNYFFQHCAFDQQQ